MGPVRLPRTVRVIPFLIVVCFVILPAQAQYSGGSGTADDPYRIATAADLIALGETPDDYDKHFILTADIDLDPNLPGRQVFESSVIGFFHGTFDGNGFSILNLTISHRPRYPDDSRAGLFTNLQPKAKVLGVSLIGAHVDGTDGTLPILDESAGILAGYNWGLISDCSCTGTVSGKIRVGGLTGVNRGTVMDCSVAANVIGEGAYTGGLVGENFGTIRYSSSSSMVVRGSASVGGTVGSNVGGDVIDCSSSGEVYGEYAVGGIVGVNGIGVDESGIVVDCSSRSTVVGHRCVGGLVGQNGWPAHIVSCSSTGTVSGDDTGIGGLIGYNEGRAFNCYSHTGVTGGDRVGGLVGTNTLGGTVVHCYSCGVVVGDSYVGGLVGLGLESDAVGCFWDKERSGQTHDSSGTGLTTAEMFDIQTYLEAGWDFAGENQNGASEIWEMPEEPGCPVLRQPTELSGQGTSDVPYLVSTAYDLGAIYHDPIAHYRLATSLDLSEITWVTSVVPAFSGVFDGNNLTIRGLRITGWSELGLFGTILGNAEVRDLTLAEVNATGLADRVGALAGTNRGKVINCHSSGQISAEGHVGGLIGYNNYDGDATVDNCSAIVHVTGGYHVGGLMGTNAGIAKNCHSDGTVSGYAQVGGLAGYSGATVRNCHSTATVSGELSEIGGLIGHNNGYVDHCHCTGPVSGGDRIGGLVGNNGWRVENSCSSSVVTGDDLAGGLIGLIASGTVENCYCTGAVSGHYEVGGLAGSNSTGSVNCCYSASRVLGVHLVGGLIGDQWNGEVTMSFWDMVASGQSASADGIRKTTAEMHAASTFLQGGWDFLDETENGTDDIWWIEEGQDYPRLWWELLTDYPNDEVAVYRFWSPAFDVYFYTDDNREKDELLEDSSGVWEYQGVAYYAYAHASEPGLVPVHRFYSEALDRHFCTSSEAEKNKLTANYSHVWTYEGIAFYVFGAGQQPADAAPVYRFWSATSSSHFYTIDEEEKDRFIAEYSDVWAYERIAWYAYKP